MRAHWQALVVAVATLVAASTVAGQHAVRWQTNLNAARQTAAQTQRLLLLHFWSETCEPCARMERDVFSRPDVAAALEANYVPVKINVRQFPMTAQQFGVTSWPADLVVTPYGHVLDRSVGYQPAHAYVGRLNQVAAAVRNPPSTPQTASAFTGSQPGTPPAWHERGQSALPSPTSSQNSAFPSSPSPYGASAMAPSAQGGRWGGPSPSMGADLAKSDERPPAWQGSSLAQDPPDESTRRYGSALTLGASQGQRGGGELSSPQAPSRPLQQSASSANATLYPTGPEAYGSSARPREMSSSAPRVEASRPTGGAAWTGAERGQVGGFTAGGSAETQVASPIAGGIWSAEPSASLSPAAGGYMPSASPNALGVGPRRNPPLALDGYCAVSLTEKERWVRGNPRFGVIHEGRTYLFAGPDEARRFYDTPDRYAPVASGNDVVLLTERGDRVPGRREYGAWYEGRIYLFSNEDSYNKFASDPRRYADHSSSVTGAALAPRGDTSQASEGTGPATGARASGSAAGPGASPGAHPPGSYRLPAEPNAQRGEPLWRY